MDQQTIDMVSHQESLKKGGLYPQSCKAQLHEDSEVNEELPTHRLRVEQSTLNDMTSIQSAHRNNGSKHPEIELLVCGARTSRSAAPTNQVTDLLRASLNWNEVIGMAARHGVVPLLYRNLSTYTHLVPAEVLEQFRVLTLNTSIQNLQMAAELSRLVGKLERNGIASLPFKGPVLAVSAYGDLSLRQFSDLDILIRKKDIQRAKELFVERGYVPLEDRTLAQDELFLKDRRPYNYKFVSANGQVCIELHWEFTSRYNSFPVDYAGLFKRLTLMEFAGQEVLQLQPEDLILLLCQHGSKHFWCRLIWLIDIVEVIRTYPALDWKKTITQAEGVGARRMLFLGLHLAERLLDLKLPAEVSTRVRSEPKISSLAARIEAQLFLESRRIQGFETHTFSCSTRERLRDKLNYSGYRVFHWLSKVTTPTERDIEALPERLRFVPLSYVIRPIRAVFSIIKPLAKESRSDIGQGQQDSLENISSSSELLNYNKRLALFRPQGNSREAWEQRWATRKLRETLTSGRKSGLEEFDRVFSQYLPRELPVLEAGCGLGQLVAALDARGYQVEGVDYAERTISRIKEAAPNLNVRVGDVYDLDSPDESYGGYISIGVFEHNPEGPLEGLKEVRRVLHPSGAALISVPLLNKARAKELRRLRTLKSKDTAEGLAFYQYYYSREEFEEYLRQAGLEVVDEFPYAVYAGITRDLPLGRWLHQNNFYFWPIQRRFIAMCGWAPMWARQRWAHMLMFVCRRAT